MPGGPAEDAGDQAAILGDDHQKPQKVLYVRSPGARRQERAAAFPGFQLPGGLKLCSQHRQSSRASSVHDWREVFSC